MRVTLIGMVVMSAEPSVSARWFVEHFGFRIGIDIGWYVNTRLAGHDNVSLDFVQRDHPSSPEVLRGKQVAGTLLALLVEDVDAEHQRLGEAGLQIVLPLVTEPWGQRRFQVAAPDGLVVEVLQAVEPDPRWLAEHSSPGSVGMDTFGY